MPNDSSASERSPTEPVSHQAADFIAIVATAAAIESLSSVWTCTRHDPLRYQAGRASRRLSSSIKNWLASIVLPSWNFT